MIRRTPPLTEPAVRISRNGLFAHIHSCSLTGIAVMRRSFVATVSPLLGTDGVSSRRSTMCRLLSSRGITPLHGYYETIRLPMRDKSLLPFTIVGTLSHPWKRPRGLPGCRDIFVSCMPWSKTPGKRTPPGHRSDAHVDFRLCDNVILPNSFFRGSIPSTLRATGPRLTAYGLHACGPTLKVGDYSPPSKDSLPGGWPTLPGRDSLPLDIATLPGRTAHTGS